MVIDDRFDKPDLILPSVNVCTTIGYDYDEPPSRIIVGLLIFNSKTVLKSD